jgi:hypothetical protein
MGRATADGKWATGAEACRILDVPRLGNVERLVAEGLVGLRRLPDGRRFPGTNRVYRREDCENLARVFAGPAATDRVEPRGD